MFYKDLFEILVMSFNHHLTPSVDGILVACDIFNLRKNSFNVLLIKEGLLLILTYCGSPNEAKHCKKWRLAWVAFSPEWAVSQHVLEYMSMVTNIF